MRKRYFKLRQVAAAQGKIVGDKIRFSQGNPEPIKEFVVLEFASRNVGAGRMSQIVSRDIAISWQIRSTGHRTSGLACLTSPAGTTWHLRRSAAIS